MALIRMEHVPQTVKVNLPLTIILPDPGKMGSLPVRERKVLYLLHGLGDDASAWQRYTSIEFIAAAYGLVVVMPSVGRSFYTDLPNGQQYFTYLVEELPQYLDDLFGMKPVRENTLIAGNSMGGYGAFKAAFMHPEKYAVAASFSAFLSMEFLQAYPDDPRLPEFTLVFGDLSRLNGSPHDPNEWFRQGAANPSALPRLYMACGQQDDLYPFNQATYATLQKLGIPVEYFAEDGRHNWPFWDLQIRHFLRTVLGEPPK